MRYEQPLEHPHPGLRLTRRGIAACQMSEEPGGWSHHSSDCPGCMARLAASALRCPDDPFLVVETGEYLTLVEGFRMRVPDPTDPVRVLFERQLAR